jgi:hypothetical protein
MERSLISGFFYHVNISILLVIIFSCALRNFVIFKLLIPRPLSMHQHFRISMPFLDLVILKSNNDGMKRIIIGFLAISVIYLHGARFLDLHKYH